MFIWANTDFNQAVPNRKWLGVLHQQELGVRFLIEETRKQSKEMVWMTST